MKATAELTILAIPSFKFVAVLRRSTSASDAIKPVAWHSAPQPPRD